MMLMARQQRKLIDAKNARRGDRFTCPACGHIVVLHHGTRVQPYFAHRPLTVCTVTSEGETNQHVRGKRQLADFFATWGPVTLERVLPTVRQRADVWLAHAAKPVALEFQCSPINRTDVLSRTQGYQRIGAYPFWILGSRFARQTLNWSLIDRFACWLSKWHLCLLFWDVTQQRLRIDHHICQSVTGQYQCQTAYVSTIAELVAGPRHRFWWPEPNIKQFRRELDRDLRRSSAALRPLQEATYLTGHHLAGFPDTLVTTQATLPVFGRGVLLWRVVLVAWLFTRPYISTATLKRLALKAFVLVEGRTAGVRFTARTAVRDATNALLTDLIQNHYLRVLPNGWQVVAAPKWFADYTRWLENDEKILGQSPTLQP